MKRNILIAASLTLAACLALGAVALAQDAVLTPQEELGKSLFFDLDLSLNANQSCATCHAAEVGWTVVDDPQHTNCRRWIRRSWV